MISYRCESQAHPIAALPTAQTQVPRLESFGILAAPATSWIEAVQSLSKRLNWALELGFASVLHPLLHTPAWDQS
jgi:hypothetical protein